MSMELRHGSELFISTMYMVYLSRDPCMWVVNYGFLNPVSPSSGLPILGP